MPDLSHVIFKNSRNAQLIQDIFPENVSILILVESTMQHRRRHYPRVLRTVVSILVLVEGTLQPIDEKPRLPDYEFQSLF